MVACVWGEEGEGRGGCKQTNQKELDAVKKKSQSTGRRSRAPVKVMHTRRSSVGLARGVLAKHQGASAPLAPPGPAGSHWSQG